MAFFTGFGVSSVVYYALNRIWPSPGAFQDFKEVDESDFALQEAEAEDTHSDDSNKGKLDAEGETDVVVKAV
jgi:nucleobase:cation symporter-1, NCS1 family